ITVITLFMGLLLLWPGTEDSAHPERKFEPGKHYPLALDLNITQLRPMAGEEKPAIPALRWKEYKVKPGESLAVVFDKVGLSPLDLYQLVNADEGT
ncbi:peptidase M23, partial [Vibrio natriegens]